MARLCHVYPGARSVSRGRCGVQGMSGIQRNYRSVRSADQVYNSGTFGYIPGLETKENAAPTETFLDLPSLLVNTFEIEISKQKVGYFNIERSIYEANAKDAQQ